MTRTFERGDNAAVISSTTSVSLLRNGCRASRDVGDNVTSLCDFATPRHVSDCMNTVTVDTAGSASDKIGLYQVTSLRRSVGLNSEPGV